MNKPVLVKVIESPYGSTLAGCTFTATPVHDIGELQYYLISGRELCQKSSSISDDNFQYHFYTQEVEVLV